MAVNFNGTTSKVENTTAALSITSLITVLAWTFADGVGETSGGIVNIDEAGNSISYFHDTTANKLRMTSVRSVTAGLFTFPVTDGQWNAVAVSYNATDTGTLPVARVNFASVTVTQVDAGIGFHVASNTGYCIGNRSAADRTWDGMLQHIQIFDRILTAQECDDGLRFVSGTLYVMTSQSITVLTEFLPPLSCRIDSSGRVSLT